MANAGGYISGPVSTFPSAANLDSDDLDQRGISLGTTGRLALMARLSEGSGLEMPKHAKEALEAARRQAAGSQFVRVPEAPNPQQLATVTAVGTQCFMLSNLFDPDVEASRNPNWVQEIRDDVIDECNRFGGVVHIYVDEKSKDGNVYVKCSTIASGKCVMNDEDKCDHFLSIFFCFSNQCGQFSSRSILFRSNGRWQLYSSSIIS